MEDRVATFVVEQAGCESCAARIRSALQPLLDIENVEIDEESDSAVVTVHDRSMLASIEIVDTALARASEGSGHQYRVRPSSWSAAGI